MPFEDRAQRSPAARSGSVFRLKGWSVEIVYRFWMRSDASIKYPAIPFSDTHDIVVVNIQGAPEPECAVNRSSHMKNSFTLRVAALACTVPQLAAAVPIHATFNGTVSGSGGFTNVLGDFPVGTAALSNVTFDDARLVDSDRMSPATMSGRCPDGCAWARWSGCSMPAPSGRIAFLMVWAIPWSRTDCS